MSLDDEQEDDYTIILLKLHRHFKEWEECLTTRGLSTESFIHRIKKDHFTKEDVVRFRTN